MLFRKNILSGKRKYLYGLSPTHVYPFNQRGLQYAVSDDFDFSRREVIFAGSDMKNNYSLAIVYHGHFQKKVHKNKYQVSFENAFTFQPDLLVNTTQRLLDKDSAGIYSKMGD